MGYGACSEGGILIYEPGSGSAALSPPFPLHLAGVPSEYNLPPPPQPWPGRGIREGGGSDALTSQLVILLGKGHSLYPEGLSDKESDVQEVREQATEMDL